MNLPNNPYVTTIVIAVLAFAALMTALTLQILHDDATKAWEAFAGLSVFFAGVHVPSPPVIAALQQSSKSDN